MTTTLRIPDEFIAWLENIEKSFEEKHSFKPSRVDILKAIAKQFTGKFIV